MQTSGWTRRQFINVSATGVAVSGMLAQQVQAELTSSEGPGLAAIDCQSHLYCPEHVALMEKRATDPIVYRKDGVRIVKMGDWERKILPNHSDVDAKLAEMDANRITLAALSINDPGPEWFGTDGAAVARMLNDYLADITRRHTARFIGLCVLPMQDEKAAQTELDRCIQHLGMRGILLYTNLAGRFPDEPQFRWLFSRAETLDVPILLHPALPVTAPQVKGYEMISTLGNMFDDTIALTRIILSGLLDRHPRLKLVCPHLGGTLPFIIGRLDHQITVLKRGPRYLTKPPSEYLRQVYLDIASPLPQAIRLVAEMIGVERLLFASDHPWVAPKLIRDSLHSAGLSAENEAKILCQNAHQMFRLGELDR